jgi:hypothetical protein
MPWRRSLVESSPPATEAGREIETRQGMYRVAALKSN